MLKTGIIGWRGMVGSVLMQRMRAEGDFHGLDTSFFSTSSPGAPGPDVGAGAAPLLDGRSLAHLMRHDVLVSCQGGDYTKAVHGPLRDAGWDGIWIDAASALRMAPEAELVLDPVNGARVRDALARGTRVFCGGNCTVSLQLMALAGLFAGDHVEWLSTMTYQAASGGGARKMRELVAQMRAVGDVAGPVLDDPAASALAVDRAVSRALAEAPVAEFGVPLAGSALPWIDTAVAGGQTREEWKDMAETNKFLGREASPIPVDGVCVRIGAMRCHAQAFTIKLRRALPMDEVVAMLDQANPWVRVVPNDKQATLAQLTPVATAGSLDVPIGRLRPMAMGPDFLAAFSVGDQLLWGAAEPLRRMLAIVREHRG